jgi:hypothetical protein
VELLINDGSGYQDHSDVDEDADHGVQSSVVRRAGEEYTRSRLVGVTGTFSPSGVGLGARLRFAFPAPGRYQLQARRRGVSSNAVVVEVEKPRAEDAALFEELSQSPELTTKVGVWSQVDRVRSLLDRFGGSAYAGRMFLARWEDELGRAPARPGVEALLLEIEATDLRHTAFEADRLLLVAEWRERIGDVQGTRRVYERLAREHPRTAAGEQARLRLRRLTIEAP